MIRLVKGAYWDAEIKRAQVEGMEGFPVFTAKSHTDVSYIANARKLLGLTDHIYPQFATHNAHTVAAVLEIAQHLGCNTEDFEFQRLHGMGEALHTIVLNSELTRCRIYAPVGAHEDLLAYLVRRLLENGANSSFVNQIVDEDVPAEVVAACPFESIGEMPAISKGPQLYGNCRRNSKGWDLTHQPTLDAIDEVRSVKRRATWSASPLLSQPVEDGFKREIPSPSNHADIVGWVKDATQAHVQSALTNAAPWSDSVETRATVLNAIADAYEDNAEEIFAILAREAGKCLPDAVAELREAVDFLRYYASEAQRSGDLPARGIWTCISPWNFPLAIFTGQIAAALAAGNAVLAKPAEQTPLIAFFAVSLMKQAGVPDSALQLLPGGGEIGAALTFDARINGVAFTGSTATAQRINAAMADHCAPGTPLIAETGGLNAMIVDSTALPEHAVRDIVNGAFRSAGQRCSALRCLYLQEDVADKVLEMLFGAMDALTVGDPWDLSTDVGPVIDEVARKSIADHVEQARADGRILHELKRPNSGTFIAPVAIEVSGIGDMEKEVFGPVLHIATFKSGDIDQVISEINTTGYGLTFGLHTRIDDRVEHIVNRIEAGNIYVNRDQIGAVVGTQPFGGEGLSGTGPKAGGPYYLERFFAENRVQDTAAASMPGPTGESNRWSTKPRDPILCLGPDCETQVKAVEALGGLAKTNNEPFDPSELTSIEGIGGVMWSGDDAVARACAQALAQRSGPIVPLITGAPDAANVLKERHVCIDTTASGGNAALLAEVSAP